MILGIGIDLVQMSRIEEILAKPDSTFIRKTFTVGEIAYCEGAGGGPAEHFAARYAAKEAFFKAMNQALAGKGLKQQMGPKDLACVEVVLSKQKVPQLVLHGRARESLEAVAATHSWLSLSHDGGTAAAVVILS